ncbi:hypothetical protein, partial [Marinobacter xestospongiae]
SGYTLTLPGGRYEYDRIAINDTGKLSVAPFDADVPGSGRLELVVTELDIADTGVLSVSDAGYGQATGQPQYVGGSHAGRGGKYGSADSLLGHGSIEAPESLGFGGKWNSEVRGGGALRVQAGT